MQKIAVAKGDGIGAEIMDAVWDIFRAANVPLEPVYVDLGKSVFEQGFKTGMTDEARQTIESLGILFKGPMETPKGAGMKSINVTARKVWNTYANKRVFRSIHGVHTVFSKANIPIDITIVRENIEDTYGGIEHMLTQDVALTRRFITRQGSLQVHRYAFEMARKKAARKVTCGHKANIMKLTDGLFLKCFYEVAKEYPEIEVNDLIVDDLAMKLVVRPQDFDVVVLPNLQGDIISDLCAGLVGGLGFAPSANIGDYISIFEAVHGTAPDIAGKGLANPTALLMSGIMMLRHLGLTKEAASIENALLFSVEIGARTIDFGNISKPALGTSEFANFIAKQLGKEPSATKPTIAIPAAAFARPERDLTKNRILVSAVKESEALIGADIFVESTLQAAEIAELFKPFCADAFQITTMSNRGTQVYPVGSVYTDCINQYRVRLESVDEKVVTPETIFQLCIQLSQVIRICSTEMLMKYGGVKAYSLAQGQS